MTKHITKFILPLLFLWGLLCGCGPTTEGQFAVIEEEIQEIISEGNLPSIQVVVIEDNQIVWSKALGENTGTDFAYMNGSVQKVVDATAVLQLHERGLVDIDEDISAYIPFQVRHPGFPDTPITIRMLLSHRAGLDAPQEQFAWDTECLFAADFNRDCDPAVQPMSLEEYLIASFTSDGSNYDPEIWVYAPDEQHHYSVSAYPLLRYLIEEVSGIPYPEYMRDNIFEPLGMENSGFFSEEFSSNHAIPHTRVDGEDIELPVWDGNGYMMRTTAEDMAAFMLAHMNAGYYNGYQLLQPETIELMHAKASTKGLFNNQNPEMGYPGYGLGIIHYQDGWMGHGGSTVGYQSLWQFKPSNKSGFIIHTNINGILGGRDDFDSVWKNVEAVSNILFKELDPLKGKTVLIRIMATSVVIGTVFNIYAYRKKRREQEQVP